MSLTLNALVVISTMYTKTALSWQGLFPKGIDKNEDLARTALHQLSVMNGDRCSYICPYSSSPSHDYLGWNMFGKINMIYVWRRSAKYRQYAVFIFLGTCASNDLVGSSQICLTS